MRKITLMILSILMALSCVLMLGACSCGKKEPEHTHTYGDWKSDATQHWKECSCGEKSELANHDTVADDGDCTTAVVCSCGYVLTPAKESHSGGTATCTAKAVCENCGKQYGELNPANHSSNEFTYVDNNDGTHTKKNKCCGTVVIANEAHEHTEETPCVCGAIKDHVHAYTLQTATEQHIASVATCETKATYYYSCSCGENGTETFESGTALGHDYHEVANSGISATCTANGKQADEKCSRCDDVKTGATINALGHDMVADVVVPATCTQTGKEAGEHCSRCDHKTGGATISALGHDFVNGTEYQKDENGHQKKCSRCDAYDAVVAHNYGGDNVCDDCGYDKTVPHTHAYTIENATAEYLKTSATCTEKAVYYKSCSCGAKGTETFESGDALGHNYHEVANSEISATCTANGKQADEKCSRCDDVKTGATINALGHDYQEVANSGIPATCTDNGKQANEKCSRCDDVKTGATINALGHNMVADMAVSATCTQTGKEAGEHCSRCDHKTGGAVIDALGHEWGTGEVTTAPQVGADGVRTFTCSVCGETKTESIDALVQLNHVAETYEIDLDSVVFDWKGNDLETKKTEIDPSQEEVESSIKSSTFAEGEYFIILSDSQVEHSLNGTFFYDIDANGKINLYTNLANYNNKSAESNFSAQFNPVRDQVTFIVSLGVGGSTISATYNMIDKMSVIFDKFGDKTIISKVKENVFVAEINIQVSKTFFAWVIGSQGKVKIKSPSSVLSQFNEFVEVIKQVY